MCAQGKDRQTKTPGVTRVIETVRCLPFPALVGMVFTVLVLAGTFFFLSGRLEERRQQSCYRHYVQSGWVTGQYVQKEEGTTRSEIGLGIRVTDFSRLPRRVDTAGIKKACGI